MRCTAHNEVHQEPPIDAHIWHGEYYFFYKSLKTNVSESCSKSTQFDHIVTALPEMSVFYHDLFTNRETPERRISDNTDVNN